MRPHDGHQFSLVHLRSHVHQDVLLVSKMVHPSKRHSINPHLDLVCLVHALLAILIVAVLEQLISCLPRGFSALTVHLLPHQEIGGFVEEHRQGFDGLKGVRQIQDDVVGLGKFGTDILHDVNHRQEGSQGDGVVEDAGGIQRHVDAHEEWAQPLGEVLAVHPLHSFRHGLPPQLIGLPGEDFVHLRTLEVVRNETIALTDLRSQRQDLRLGVLPIFRV
mmetsp:Transcript_76586/g.155467  ORF Transcript_76586/g.155467 Transcript_76586/m.155467 type:complete len:219 (-) Transcript_76586:1144-1800(-)